LLYYAFSIILAFSSHRKKAAKIKADYKRDYFHPNAEVDFDFAGPMVTAASVFG
jgi:hypothetical protein